MGLILSPPVPGGKALPSSYPNNKCLALGFVVKRHLDEIELDIDPLLGFLSTLPWTTNNVIHFLSGE